MFESDFYPTPPELIEKLIAPYWSGDALKDHEEGRRPIRAILDPSAGCGDILDWVRERATSRHGAPKLYAIENHPDRIHVLHGKGYRVLANDFLTYVPENRFDLVIMNPPFQAGAKHLLHAWDVLPEGDIACLLNAETLRNPYSAERKLLGKVIEDHGTVEWLGQAFRTAERQTDVAVALVRLKKQRRGADELRFEFSLAEEGEGEEPAFRPEDPGNAVMRPDQVGAILRRYACAKQAFVNYLKAREELAFMTQGILEPGTLCTLLEESSTSRYSWRDNEDSYEAFRDGLRARFWEHVLAVSGFEKCLTTELRDTFRTFCQNQGSMALTRENIAQVLSMIVLNSGTILDRAVVDVFDLFTRYHSKNRCHPEGWKTNSAWKVNRRVILPHWVQHEFGRFGLSWTQSERYQDIDKVMAYLTGRRLEDVVTVSAALEESWKKDRSGKCVSTFFEIRYYMKGTVHLFFRDEALWEKFNLVACKGKNWIGGD